MDIIFSFCLVVCEAGEFTCLAENRCLPMSYVCDGIPDCQIGGGNQPDELNCTTGIYSVCIEYSSDFFKSQH